MSSFSVSAIPISKKNLLNRYEAAQLLGISCHTIDSLVLRGEIRFRLVGDPLHGCVMFTRSDLKRFAEGRPIPKE